MSKRHTKKTLWQYHNTPEHFRRSISMSRHISLFPVVLAFLLFVMSVGAFAQFPTEKPKGYVNDFAGVLRPAMRQQLEALCKELDEKTKAQLAIVTVRSLEGRPLEEFTIDLATRWGIGGKGSDRGVMLFLAIQDRRSRIEVGYGLEPIIPDGKAGGILRDMTPYLRNGDYDGAVLLGASTIAQIIAQDAKVTLPGAAIPRPGSLPPSGVSTPEELSWFPFLPLFLVLVFIVASVFPIAFPLVLVVLGVVAFDLFLSGSFIGLVLLLISVFVIAILGLWLRPQTKRWMGWSGWGGSGGWGGFGGGGGGFGGFGGGGFGGGGASGSW